MLTFFLTVPNLNVKYQQVRVVSWDAVACNITETCDSSGCRLPTAVVFDIKDKGSQQAVAFYSRYHIQYVKLVEMTESLKVSNQRLVDMNNQKPICGILFKSPCNSRDIKDQNSRVDVLKKGLDGWNYILKQEEILSAASMTADHRFSGMTPIIPESLQSNAVLLKQSPVTKTNKLNVTNRIQFSGGGNVMSMTLSSERDKTTTTNGEKPSVYNHLTIEGPTIETGVNVAGIGVQAHISPFIFANNYEYINDHSETSHTSTSISFQLGDDDPQDEFVIDLYYDNKYGGVVFDTVGGRSKCPHERGTAAVEVPNMEVVSYPSTKVSAGDDLLFSVELSNKGMGMTTLTLSVNPMDSADGLVITVDGVNMDVGLNIPAFGSFNNLYPRKIRKLVRIHRGPNLLSVPAIQLTLDSTCEGAEVGNVILNPLGLYNAANSWLYNTIDSESGQQVLQWIAECPHVQWADSIKFNNGFLVNSQTDINSLTITIFNPSHDSFNLASHSRLQLSSSRISLLYRLIGTQQWNIAQMNVNGTTVDSNFLALTEDAFGFILMNWAIGFSFIQDGAYEITVKVVCDNIWNRADEVTLPTVVGVIDRTRPERYGGVIPYDDSIHIGEELSIAFTKPLLCVPIPFEIELFVKKSSLLLRKEQLHIRCHDNIISFVIDLTRVDYRLLQGDFTVEIGRISIPTAGIRDVNGNPTDPNKGNVKFVKNFLPLGMDTQTTFTFSATSNTSGHLNNSICSACPSSVDPKNCTSTVMKQYQESLIRNDLSLMMTLDPTDRISVTNINCLSNTVTATVTFTNPFKPTPSPTTIKPTKSMKPSLKRTKTPTLKPSRKPSSRPTTKATSNPSPIPSSPITENPRAPTLKPSPLPTFSPSAIPTNLQFRSTPGLIYNIGSGYCVDYTNKIALLKCTDDNNSTNQQSWKTVNVQGFYNSFLIQTNTNVTSNARCIDVESGIIISLSTCNSTKNTQQWSYDYNKKFLRMKDKPNSCLASSPTLTQLQLKSCTSYDYSQGWGEYMISGGTRDSTNFTYLVCPPGEKITKITGRGGNIVDQITMVCENGKILGPVGGSGGLPNQNDLLCPSGYIGFSVTYGSYVGKIVATCAQRSNSVIIGLASGAAGVGYVNQSQAEGTQKIIGFYVKSGLYVDAINVIYGNVRTNPTASPTNKPTIDSSLPILARYIKLSRSSPSGLTSSNQQMINILGIDVYDDVGTFISDQSVPYINQVFGNNSALYGPQFLIDGVHQGYNGSQPRIPRTVDSLDAYMQLDFGKDVMMSRIEVWNPTDLYANQINGTLFTVTNNAGTALISQALTVVQPSYKWLLGPQPASIFRSTVGPIRNQLGQCIDVPDGHYYFGVQAMVYDCNGSSGQQWARATTKSSDLRLQTQNNNTYYCMDASGMNGAVVLQACNTMSQSQKWIYDGRNLRPQSDTGLCLALDGAVSPNGTKLIVQACGNGLASTGGELSRRLQVADTIYSNSSNRPPSSWGEYSSSMIAGNTSGTYIHYLCPLGSKVIKISGRVGVAVDQINITCDDPLGTILGSSGAGGAGSNWTASPYCFNGYNALSIRSANFVSQILASCVLSSSLNAVIGLSKDFVTATIALQGNERVIGMSVYSAGSITGLAFTYSESGAWRQTASPMLFPTMRPTISIKPSTIRTRKPTGRPTLSPTAKPSRNPTSSRPTAKRSRSPTSKPSRSPTSKPSRSPTVGPSRSPTAKPSRMPTAKPSARPTATLSRRPTSKPSKSLPAKPSRRPSAKPSTTPTAAPSRRPTVKPSRSPTAKPSRRPSAKPSRRPTAAPSRRPTAKPSRSPTAKPSRRPSAKPSARPTAAPSRRPTAKPSRRPTSKPSRIPSAKSSARLTGTVINTCRNPNLTIPDLKAVNDSITISQSYTVREVQIFVNISHTWIGDLQIDLKKGNMTVRLHNNTCGWWDFSCYYFHYYNFYSLIGTYPTNLLPAMSLGVFNGATSDGTWTLLINDTASGHSGVLNRWCLMLQENSRRLQVVDAMNHNTSTELLLNLMRNMDLSDHEQYGRHLKTSFTSPYDTRRIFSDVRISDIQVSNPSRTSANWLFFDSHKKMNHLTPSKKVFYSLSPDKIDDVTKVIESELSKAHNDMKQQISKMKDELAEVIKDLIKEEAMKQNKLTEDKLDRISRLLERVLGL